jgi:serine protease inhibitor ecotin
MTTKELKKRIAMLTPEEKDEIQYRLWHGEDSDHWSYLYIMKCNRNCLGYKFEIRKHSGWKSLSR